MRDGPIRKHRLLTYLATAGVAPAAVADIQVYDGPPIGIGWSGSVTLSLDEFQVELGAGRWSNTSFNGGEGWTTCCSFIDGQCVEYSQIYETTYRGSKWLQLNCDSGLESVSITKLGAIVSGARGCFASTQVCSFSNRTLIACGDADSSGFDDCFRTRRFHVGFTALKDGTRVFGWIQIDGSGWGELEITNWAYDDSGSPIVVGALPPAPCAGDLNADAVVDSGDLGLLLTAWGSCGKNGPGCLGDLDADGVVDATDIGLLLVEWGHCDLDPCFDVDCDDGDPCTADTCLLGECYFTRIPGCNTCCEANGTPGCDDADCAIPICGSIPSCCEIEWDETCAQLANIFCDCP